MWTKNSNGGRQVARLRQAAAARSTQKKFLIEKEVKAAAVGSGTSQNAKDAWLKSQEGQNK